MRHRKLKGKLGRSLVPRIRLLRKLITYLVDRDRIETTVARAKAVAPIAQKLMKDAFENTPESRERILSMLYRKELALKIFGEMRERYKTSGNIPMTTIWLNGFRRADAMPRAIVEFVDTP
jgi:large subunit ribosomal protein L17